jgi:uncharacterized membrane protein
MEEKEIAREREIRSLYDLGLLLKAVSSAFEIIGGVLVLFVSRSLVLHIGDLVTQGELAHDPNDFIATTIRDAAQAFAVHAHYVLAAYLLLRGVIKLGLIVLILRRVQVAYPLFIIALGLFGSYEAYRAVLTSNALLGSVALFDTMLILLTAYEYKRKNYSSSGYVAKSATSSR